MVSNPRFVVLVHAQGATKTLSICPHREEANLLLESTKIILFVLRILCVIATRVSKIGDAQSEAGKMIPGSTSRAIFAYKSKIPLPGDS